MTILALIDAAETIIRCLKPFDANPLWFPNALDKILS